MAASHLILGGARSGKSRYALAQQPPNARVVFVATARPGDADMVARIARHRAERPSGWTTVEAPRDLIGALGRLPAADAVLVDCLTLWVANHLVDGDPDETVLRAADDLARLAARPPWTLTLVSNEVGEGVHPETAAGLRFRDLLGLVNQRIAAAAERVTFMVAGLPLTVKAPALRPPFSSHDVAPQAP
ncbi:MAG TPA: bifunctional adenosylcobinamide kinase/adenosylcobinamide-phosphate guanylyltransferase [Candidatus Binatia bacterium]|nr:bifunctional adenosylcobinamide kinase/adenosylcobinamide-phosphate guanylyltransferase [Candidatus Binatia bacterium]